jgi:DNA-binding PadR family transcriptional regulator
MSESTNQGKNDCPVTETHRTPIAHGDRIASLPAFARDLLWAIDRRGPSKGVALKSEIERYYAQPQNHGRVYPNLDRLIDDGLVAKVARDKRTNEYALTELGEEVLDGRRAWIDGNEDSEKAGDS